MPDSTAPSNTSQPRQTHLVVCAAVIVVALVLAGCTGGSSVGPSATTSSGSGAEATAAATTQASPTTARPVDVTPRPDGPSTLKVPADFPTIQAAVDAARPNDLVLIAAGTYSEEVIVRIPSIVIRGEDRNRVVLDGKDELGNGFQVSANGVAVENLTVKRYQVNGIVFTKAYDSVDQADAEVLQGYRASYVTVANNGLYGLYAFFASGGQFDHVYGSGHPDGGIYIGQCKPCNAVVTDAVMERNGIGYSGTNASGNLFIINSVWRRNRIGMTPNSQVKETLAPQGDVVIAGNLVEDNDDPETPPAASGAFGFGIGIGGGERNLVLKNRVVGHATVGISLSPLEEFLPVGNRIEGNVLSENAVDLAYFSSKNTLVTGANCFVGNTFVSSSPAEVETVMGCDIDASTSITTDPSPFVRQGPAAFDYRKIPLPPDQPGMTAPLSATAVPASAEIPTVDLSIIKVPE
jgi:Right handed beta helix region